MARYFFRICDGEKREPDEVGVDLPDQDHAWREATMALGEMIRDRDGELASDKEWSMDVSDDAGPVFTLHLTVQNFRR